MSKPTLFWLAAIAILGGWFFWQNFQIDGIETLKVTPRKDFGAPIGRWAGWGQNSDAIKKRNSDTIRIATFNIQTFGEAKLQRPQVIDALARIVRTFDVIAVQEIRAKTQDVLPEFLRRINADGSNFDYVIGPRLGRTTSKEQYAFIFNRASVEVDRSQLYTIEDPEDLLHREPFVAWFRVRGPHPSEAFTFSLVNMHVDPDEVTREMNFMPGVFSTVRNDSREEDDVILLGDFNADERRLGPITRVASMAWVVSGETKTNVLRTEQFDNILFDQNATREFTGRCGVFDFLREFNLSLDEAQEISDHLPVWAEFSIYEGGVPGRLAEQPSEFPR